MAILVGSAHCNSRRLKVHTKFLCCERISHESQKLCLTAHTACRFQWLENKLLRKKRATFLPCHPTRCHSVGKSHPTRNRESRHRNKCHCPSVMQKLVCSKLSSSDIPNNVRRMLETKSDSWCRSFLGTLSKIQNLPELYLEPSPPQASPAPIRNLSRSQNPAWNLPRTLHETVELAWCPPKTLREWTFLITLEPYPLRNFQDLARNLTRTTFAIGT